MWTVPAVERFAEVVASEAPQLQDKALTRRALNMILLALEILVDAGLSMEAAIPILRGAFPEERQPSESSNPRRERLAQIADVRMTTNNLRQMLALIEPWRQMAAEAQVECDAARAGERDAKAATAAALEALDDRERTVKILGANSNRLVSRSSH